MELKNLMEVLVLRKLDQIIGEEDVCDCENCKLDIAAIALNILPPKYYVTDTGEVYSRAKALHVQFETDIITAIFKGIDTVKSKPRHKK